MLLLYSCCGVVCVNVICPVYSLCNTYVDNIHDCTIIAGTVGRYDNIFTTGKTISIPPEALRLPSKFMLKLAENSQGAFVVPTRSL